MAKHFAPCNNKECEKHSTCERFLDEKNVQYINYKNYFINDGCPWYSEIPTEIINTNNDV